MSTLEEKRPPSQAHRKGWGQVPEDVISALRDEDVVARATARNLPGIFLGQI